MNPLVILGFVAMVAVGSLASPTNQNSMKPSQWLKPSELESTPSLDELTFEELEKMPLEKGAKLMRKIYHLAQIENSVSPNFVPSPSNVPVYIFNGKGEKETCNLNNYVDIAKNKPKFGEQEVTVFITGLPQSLDDVKKANTRLIQAYIQRYSQKPTPPRDDDKSKWENEQPVGGHLVVIDLGHTITDMERYASLDVKETGKMIGKTFAELMDECDVDVEDMHVVAQGIATNVGGSAGKDFKDITTHKLDRITALDPARQVAKNPKVLSGLARGSANFVDAIHTSALGMGTTRRVGDVDFFPHGPCEGVPGTRNVIEAQARATRFYAESVRPGNSRNFPALEASSLKQYRNKDSYGKRAYMGIATRRDTTGDYILEVNEQTPFGKRSAPQQRSVQSFNSENY
ncbi:vitellogenin-1-like precursor [Musca domestica]|uniref:Vitellogenin-1-like precursor n=1 Tax=Musca domestica TaxID=7370 RepID=Q25455_MUSDO|nr:vitellogenin-1-like precursor [Musca domestica]CAA65732.1 yolk protein 3 [Musca domestica]